ncbi:homoserine dehydrogenase [Geomicrobium sp. JCM 19039]|nr:homoserine dehydrogenase [Geomicrobium sp. JCM 19039]
MSINDLYKGTLHDENGLDMAGVFKSLDVDGTLEHYKNQKAIKPDWDAVKTIENTNADVIVELTFTDVLTGEPAITHCKTAIEAGKHVVMTNKGPIVKAYQQLKEAADKKGVEFLFEGTVMSGTPALRMPLMTLKGNTITRIEGILNGTTNSMLTDMASGMSYEDSLDIAKQKGYAEADPTNDVEGYDVQGKVVILANVLLGASLTRHDVPCTGITKLTREDFKKAKDSNQVWKLLGVVENDGNVVTARVEPKLLTADDPLAQINGPMNAVTYQCDLSGNVTLIGAGAGITETGFAVLIDILSIR